ncbi:putative small lipoprotein YifL [Actinoplanes octamycinicus]|uniref:Putative small lipoprotein YifL n=1 Tax=Actinoplanes octamycinicus TaxID=135948 RepID=A0A7W7H0S1_9ACTN|nr:putative small lipoprotein YifL [Actinoplanes octamycinicus]
MSRIVAVTAVLAALATAAGCGSQAPAAEPSGPLTE